MSWEGSVGDTACKVRERYDWNDSLSPTYDAVKGVKDSISSCWLGFLIKQLDVLSNSKLYSLYQG